ncbi:predicted protein [Cyanophage PSS2]|uniref:hypothetical protein n=1 Tax=Cyanophage PSS2 TaxID=658401 RepID=UPI0001B0402E|nr:hypothetical protein PSS2_gp087 [Cyanophage PSS2]ACT65649.1 hypothetical protein [Cyanophage PSS2]ACY75790.1 predicted protein [Cyanophage PSS2]
MTDLNAKIIPLRTETPGLAPTAAQLDVGEIATNLEEGLIYSKKTDGTVVTLGGSSGGGGGATAVDDLTDVDTSTTAPVHGEALVWDSTDEEWKPGVAGFGTAAGATTITFQTGDMSTYPLHGAAGFYANQAGIEADGFTYIPSSNNADDTSLAFTPPSKFQGIQFLNGLVPNSPNHAWRVNTNGGVYYDSSAGTNLNGRSGNALDDAEDADLYISWFSQDTETRLAGYKEITDGGRTWLVVRVDFKVPYNNESGGFPCEAWFATDGSISVRYGAAVDTATFDAGVNKNLIVNGDSGDGAQIPELSPHEDVFDGLTGTGDYAVNFLVTSSAGNPGRVLSDLVNVESTAPTAGQALIWDGTDNHWEPGNPTGTIQNSTDYGLDSEAINGLTFPTFTSDVPNQVNGEWRLQDGDDAFEYCGVGTDAGSIQTEMALLQAGDTVTLRWSDGSKTDYVIDTTHALNSGPNGYWISFTTDVTVPPAVLSGELTILSTRFTNPVFTALEDGDLLRWVSASSEFRPDTLEISELENVSTAPPIPGQGLIYDLISASYIPGNPDLNGLSNVNAPSPTNGQVLSYDEPNSEWIATTSTGGGGGLGTSSVDELADVDTTTVAPTTGQALTWDGSNWTPGVAVDNLGRIALTHTTASLATNASEDVDQAGTGNGGMILSLTTDVAAWVVAYVSTAARTSDGSRLRTEDPESGSGVVAEFVTTGAETLIATPPPMYFNADGPLNELYLRVTNLDSPGAVTYDLVVSRTEP